MRFPRRRSFAAALAALAALSFVAPAEAKDRISVLYSGDDSVGQRLAYALRQKIASSYLFELVDGNAGARIEFKLTTLDPDSHSSLKGTRTIYSSVIVLINQQSSEFYFTSSVGKCGSDVLASCAESLLSDLANDLAQLRR